MPFKCEELMQKRYNDMAVCPDNTAVTCQQQVQGYSTTLIILAHVSHTVNLLHYKTTRASTNPFEESL